MWKPFRTQIFLCKFVLACFLLKFSNLYHFHQFFIFLVIISSKFISFQLSSMYLAQARIALIVDF
jgi:hypothetical protein